MSIASTCRAAGSAGNSFSAPDRLHGPRLLERRGTGVRYFVPVLSGFFISASTIWSMLKLADRWLGGYSLNV
jgi:hypothetical protein